VDRSIQRGRELVALAVATAFVYKALMGRAIEPMEIRAANVLIHEVAHALSNVAPIYGMRTDDQTAKALSPLQLLEGTFERGATVLRTSTGIEYRQLSIRRDDMLLAVALLNRAGVKFNPSAVR
jgi:hypothetical protein